MSGLDVGVVTLKTHCSSTKWLMERNHTSKKREGVVGCGRQAAEGSRGRDGPRVRAQTAGRHGHHGCCLADECK